MGKFGGIERRNHGWGKRVAWAGRQVLIDRFGGGHFGSVQSHAERWRLFDNWLKTQGIRDMRKVDRDLVERYAAYLRTQDLAAPTVQNRISTVNVVMRHAREGRWECVSPRALAGAARSQVRQEAPVSLDRHTYGQARDSLREAGLDRAAAALALAREFGVRSKEATLADLTRWAKEAERYGKINVQEGTKGGRGAPRWVPVTEEGRKALAFALKVRPPGSERRNLIAPGENYAIWLHGELREGRDRLHEFGLRGYHDARAGYACERYKQMTGREAPVVAGRRTAGKDADRQARQVIAHELGHGRTDVTVAYLGSSR
ncbi:integrase domain-containing protein [Methylohalobius crimeensis]|uniref:integrase domain-containing protein n=1 Tax=Methylohalobius crimeensis TaxID=244365 RepID=UPI0003B56C95|nr:integrase domain-containing protein [Methylohalobius crimeensis]